MGDGCWVGHSICNWRKRYVCESHLILDFAVYNSDTLTLLLREEGAVDEVTVLLQLPLSSCLLETVMTKTTPQEFSPEMAMQTLDVGPYLPRASASYQNGVLGHSVAVSGVRTTASMLLNSKRRIRLFLLEEGDGDDDDDEEDEDDTGLGNGSATKAGHDSTADTTGGNDTTDGAGGAGVGGGAGGGDDDKENVME